MENLAFKAGGWLLAAVFALSLAAAAVDSGFSAQMLIVSVAALAACWFTVSRADYAALARGQVKAAADQSRYDDDPIRWGVIATLFWGIAGFLAGLYIALQLAYPALNLGLEYTTFGRLRPLHTPALLGAAVLQGLRDPEQLIPRLDVVVGYTIFHFAVFVVFGIAVAAFLLAAEREPRILLGVFILFLCFQVFFFGFLQALDVLLAGALPWWNVAIGNLLASVAMITYFFLGHRSLGTRLLERWTEED